MQIYFDGKIPEQPHQYFVYGAGGTGKTSLLNLFKGKKFLFSFDMSTNVVREREDTDVAVLEESDAPQVQQLVLQTIIQAVESKKYKVICLDNMSSLQNLVLENIDGRSKDGRQNYQKLQLWFRQLGMYLRNSGVTVLATAHQIDNGGSLGNGRFSPDMNDKTFNAFTSMFDFVGRIYKKDGSRWIDCDPEQGNQGKNRIDDRTLIHAEDLLEVKEEKKVEEK
ncbi:AAA family ATPase [Lactobacillus salivarius]|uniref:AAA family ATPase n=1 Tax=Ligilactobacillus salivarius TaxID=1624 RepID=UPI0013690B25|nr:AAA family ATPase [Ligilactobacillus salivarius]MYU71113.1 AAA family ATPase [Ligilactobacillus salivarius]MYZ75590.1 AAA family ATPase [Ligilactobacillus salivarius]